MVPMMMTVEEEVGVVVNEEKPGAALTVCPYQFRHRRSGRKNDQIRIWLLLMLMQPHPEPHV